MKKLYTRIAACSLAVLIAFNTVAIPKAEASMSMLSVGFSTALSAYLNGIGFTIDAKCGGPLEDIAYDVREWHENTIMPIWEKYEKAIDMTFDYATLIANGVNMSVSKQVRFSPELCSIFSEFAAWLIDEYGLEETVESGALYPIYTEQGFFDIEGNFLPVTFFEQEVVNPSAYYDKLYTYPCPNFGETYDYGAFTLETYTNSSGTPKTRFYVGSTLMGSYVGTSPDYRFAFWCAPNVDDFQLYCGSFYDVGISELYPFGKCLSGSYCKPQTLLSSIDFTSAVDNTLSASLAPFYAGTPDVAENQEFVIALPADSDITTWDGFRDYVAQRDLEDIYTPEAVTVEDAQIGTIEGEGTEEDTTTILGINSGILDWTKKIWSSIQSIPQSIAEAIKGIFVPDAALTTEITDAFAAKFSFVPTLHKLGTDLLSIGPDSKPPVVYIHLEDAEGAIDYGGTTKALDMSWYQRYKEDGDRIIGGFLWLGFLWLLFKRVPAIINGGEMVQEYTAAIDRGTKRRKH